MLTLHFSEHRLLFKSGAQWSPCTATSSNGSSSGGSSSGPVHRALKGVCVGGCFLLTAPCATCALGPMSPALLHSATFFALCVLLMSKRLLGALFVQVG